MLKIFDFAETIMFVLRKKYQQVSGLHVYHHISTVLYVWIFLRYLIHGHIIFMLMLNCTVHVILYSYYFLSACGPKMQQRISPFKKWITIIQMVSKDSSFLYYIIIFFGTIKYCLIIVPFNRYNLCL
ncbi:Elongation of very long chain fatty acids protein [Ooceraea biroi]|uniref:Elongation of very long chain fatty acids protein n=1 Tax=Ooceraea biroi TaxID=2015173 RepID=A0A026W6M1_OOCBI|nr:Elongation of very long chain fatty acids protein [Ooceraea biroi]